MLLIGKHTALAFLEFSHQSFYFRQLAEISRQRHARPRTEFVQFFFRLRTCFCVSGRYVDLGTMGDKAGRNLARKASASSIVDVCGTHHLADACDTNQKLARSSGCRAAVFASRSASDKHDLSLYIE